MRLAGINLLCFVNRDTQALVPLPELYLSQKIGDLGTRTGALKLRGKPLTIQVQPYYPQSVLPFLISGHISAEELYFPRIIEFTPRTINYK